MPPPNLREKITVFQFKKIGQLEGKEERRAEYLLTGSSFIFARLFLDKFHVGATHLLPLGTAQPRGAAWKYTRKLSIRKWKRSPHGVPPAVSAGQIGEGGKTFSKKVLQV